MVAVCSSQFHRREIGYHSTIVQECHWSHSFFHHGCQTSCEHSSYCSCDRGAIFDCCDHWSSIPISLSIRVGWYLYDA